jgi:hypothetical protein
MRTVAPSAGLRELLSSSGTSRLRAVPRQRFNKLAVLADAVPCYRLFFPYDFSQLPAVCEVVTGLRPKAD